MSQRPSRTHGVAASACLRCHYRTRQHYRTAHFTHTLDIYIRIRVWRIRYCFCCDFLVFTWVLCCFREERDCADRWGLFHAISRWVKCGLLYRVELVHATPESLASTSETVRVIRVFMYEVPFPSDDAHLWPVWEYARRGAGLVSASS